eukprot:CAMPEP_0206444438 /NCGR_PEP_ID=MMETSP0324_2-20121206/14911_1 /ASSEMBLY_ACC=CAM_ASM_000836 /TAXON_ID=2866 /ORGANISM="Crypthecodinium cohnii, Strain Seligo" /LENGTH=683 /DNA_ID=CAMNT_0053912459 /DNA_START=28 /DNA_END=2079 /DNA_ORIENTATION=-
MGSPARLTALWSQFVVLAAILAACAWLLRIQRSPLPLAAIADLAKRVNRTSASFPSAAAAFSSSSSPSSSSSSSSSSTTLSTSSESGGGLWARPRIHVAASAGFDEDAAAAAASVAESFVQKLSSIVAAARSRHDIEVLAADSSGGTFRNSAAGTGSRGGGGGAAAAAVGGGGGGGVWKHLKLCSGPEVASLQECLQEHYENDEHDADVDADGDAGEQQLSMDFALLLVPGWQPGQPAELVLDAGQGAALRLPVVEAAAAAAASTDSSVLESLARSVFQAFQETWFRPSSSLSSATTLFEMAPAYVFSFLLVGDCERRARWNFEERLYESYLQRFLQRLRLFAEIELDSQVVQCGSLSGSSNTSSNNKILDAATLRAEFLRRAGEWPPDSVTKDSRWLPPLLRFVAFKSSAAASVRVVDDSGKLQRSFAVQGWGVISVVNADGVKHPCATNTNTTSTSSEGGDVAEEDAEFLNSCQEAEVVSAWISSMRSWLGLSPQGPSLESAAAAAAAAAAGGGSLVVRAVAPSIDGISTWEMLPIYSEIYNHFLARAVETLQNLGALIESLPDVAVPTQTGDLVNKAVESAEECLRLAAVAATAGTPSSPKQPPITIAALLSAARSTLQLALAASHDDSVVAETYFSWEFKYAVYLPIGLPFAVPILFAVFRTFRRAYALQRKAKGAKTA